MSFDNVVGGKLSLKGGALPVVGGIKKKKKKSKANELALTHATHDEEAHELSPGDKKEQDRRTEAEKRYAEKARKAEERVVQRMAEKSNRERIQDFNEHLSKLSEHYDIPRVGPG